MVGCIADGGVARIELWLYGCLYCLWYGCSSRVMVVCLVEWLLGYNGGCMIGCIVYGMVAQVE